MDSSLKPRTNIVVCVLWAALVSVGLLFVRPLPTYSFLVAAALGILAGTLQSKCLHTAKAQFETTNNMLDVRKVMMSSWRGKLSIWLLWFTFAGLLLLHLPSLTPMSILAVASGTAAFQLCRDLV